MRRERIAALDIGGTKIKASLFENGVPQITRETDTLAAQGARSLLQRAGDLLERFGSFDAVGISTAGQVDVPTGTIRYANDNLPGYTGTPVRSYFQSRFDVPCTVMNDAYAAARGEGTYGAARGFSDFCCVTYGTGVGGGIFLNKEPYYGSGGSAGALIGGLVTHPELLRPDDPFAGTYERTASTTALVAAAKRTDPALDCGRDIFACLDQQEAVRKILEAWMDEVAIGLLSLLHLFNFPCLVLGGGILEQPLVIDGVARRVRARAIPGFQDALITAAKLGNMAGLYGAMQNARQAQHFFN